MLEHTFVHIPGIGKATERDLWAHGIHTWHDADRLDPSSRDVRPRAQAQLRKYLPDSHRALKEKKASFFSRLCGLGEAWRVFGHFATECVFLDIETTGLSPAYDQITIVGLYDGEAYKVFIAGDNLDTLLGHLSRYRVLITFNGTGFDLRSLTVKFPDLVLPPVHIDLRWVTKKLGLTGGLKAIEATLGLQRDTEIQHLTGFDAVILWRQYLRGDRQALDRLIQYNAADVVHLQTIMETCYKTLSSQLRATWGVTHALDSATSE